MYARAVRNVGSENRVSADAWADGGLMQELACVILRIFTYSLDLQEDFFDKRLHEQAHTLRFLHYPPLDAASVETASEQSSYTHHHDAHDTQARSC